jgi:hypothetical protein
MKRICFALLTGGMVFAQNPPAKPAFEVASVKPAAPAWLAQQTFLAERFGLKIHHEERTVPVFAMTVAKAGPKFQQSPPGDDPNAGICKSSGGQHQCISGNDGEVRGVSQHEQPDGSD